MLTIYIEEAHPQNEWFFPEAPDVLSGDAVISSHQCLEDRLAAARKFKAAKSFPIELVVDSMENNIVDRYLAWPERLYIIVDGVVVYQGGNGEWMISSHIHTNICACVCVCVWCTCFVFSLFFFSLFFLSGAD